MRRCGARSARTQAAQIGTRAVAQTPTAPAHVSVRRGRGSVRSGSAALTARLQPALELTRQCVLVFKAEAATAARVGQLLHAQHLAHGATTRGERDAIVAALSERAPGHRPPPRPPRPPPPIGLKPGIASRSAPKTSCRPPMSGAPPPPPAPRPPAAAPAVGKLGVLRIAVPEVRAELRARRLEHDMLPVAAIAVPESATPPTGRPVRGANRCAGLAATVRVHVTAAAARCPRSRSTARACRPPARRRADGS
jgi:hypothetical protein